MGKQSFDLVLLDVMLPDMSGLGSARGCRQRGRMEPVVMISARDRTEDAISGIDAGADDYITKPFDLDVLLAKVRGVLRRQVWGRVATPAARPARRPRRPGRWPSASGRSISRASKPAIPMAGSPRCRPRSWPSSSFSAPVPAR